MPRRKSLTSQLYRLTRVSNNVHAASTWPGHVHYALVEAEAILACQTVGLDPGLGMVHADARGRQSLALDVMVPFGPRSTPSCSPSWSSAPAARSTSWIRPMAMFAFAHRSRTSWPRIASAPSRLNPLGARGRDGRTGVWRDFRVIPGRWHRAGKVFPLRVR
jgi:hypothetical protein